MNVEITPSIVIGLGGTGFDVVHQLSEEFYQNYGDVPIVQFIAIDTDQTNANCDKHPNFQFLHLSVNNPAEYIEGMKNNYHIGLQGWMPDNVTVGDLSSGAKNNRLNGRFALIANISKFRTAFMEKLYFISKKNSNQNMRERGYNITKDLKVFVVNSGCGGCGSGMFIDIAYNIRDMLKSGKGVALSGYMITPDVFEKSETNLNMSGNSYAALRELDYFMDSRYFAWDYSRKVSIEVNAKPFDFYYVLDSRSEEDRLILDYDDVIPIIKDAIKLEIASTIGGILNGRRTNEDEILDNHFVDAIKHRNYIQAYGSFGTAAHYYPGFEFKALCSNLFTERLVEKILNKPEGFDSVVESSYNILITPKQMGFSIEEMKNHLVCDHHFDEYSSEADKEEMVGALRKWKDNEIRSAAIGNLMGAPRRQIAEALKKHMQENIKLVMNDSAQGLPVALQIFEKLELQISGNNAELIGTPEKPGLIQQQETEVKNLDDTCSDILKVLGEDLNKKPHILYKWEVKKQLGYYIDAARDLFNAYVELLKLNAIRDTYVELKDETIAIRKKLEHLSDNLANMHIALKRDNNLAKETLFIRKATGTSSIIGNNERELVTNYGMSRKSVDQIHKHICENGIDSWLAWDYAQLNETLIQYGKEQYEGVKFDITHVIGNSLKSMLKDLYEDTHVRMTYSALNREFTPYELPQYYLLGVPEHLQARCREVVSELSGGNKITVVPTSDDYTLSYVTYKYGLPIVAMRPLLDMKKDYEMSQKPVHIFGNSHKLPDIDGEKLPYFESKRKIPDIDKKLSELDGEKLPEFE